MRAAGWRVVGASTDPAAKNKAWAEEIGLSYPLISDPDASAVQALGIDNGSGRAKRTTFLLDRQGYIEKIFQDVKVDGHADEVLRTVQALS